MEAMVQLNARMSRSLKISGDEALSQIGLTPTQAVRALWEKASRRGKDLEEVAALLDVDSRDGSSQDSSAVDELQKMWVYMDEVYLALGIGNSDAKDMPSDEELLEQALCERLAERGLA